MDPEHRTIRSVELCRITTSDGLLLDGSLQRPMGATQSPPQVDAYLLIHGTGSNFYAGGVLESFAAGALQAGSAVQRINTRGHDGISSIAVIDGPSRKGGAAYETISECRLDVAAWLDLLTSHGYARVALVGHSMGAVKAIYAQALDRHASVRAVIAISPPRFRHGNFMTHEKAEPFRADHQRAMRMVEAGHGDELMPVTQPLPMLLTASGFLAKYGAHDEYDIVRHLPNVDVPTMVMVGDQSARTSPAFDGLPEALDQLAEREPLLTFRLVKGADTNYRGCLDRPFLIADEWFAAL